MNIRNMQLNDWTFKASIHEKWLAATVPGCVHTDLLKHGIIPPPFEGTNENEVQWIDKQDWEYETQFDIEQALFDEEHIRLVFMGLDTYADVYLNDVHILSADNMFRTWTVDAKDHMKLTGNKLHVRFRSPINEDLPKLEALGYALPATNDQSEVGGLGDKKVSIFARKAPYHYGWDWGPRFVTSGIWREVRVEGWSDVRIEDVFIRQDKVSAELAELTAQISIEVAEAWAGMLRLSTDDGMSWEKDVDVAAGIHTIEMKVEIAEPKLWWSRGLGEPHLMHFTAEAIVENAVVASKEVRTGLRSVRLVRDNDEWGSSFYFELNGVPVFAKGANHIPNDSFLSEVTYERYRHEIVSAVESNMNMLRVWGGGVYEDDVFYELCDEHGLLVWQDFMFACSMYPGDEAFLASVRAEAEDNVKRLRNHPSIVLWCGNNEMDYAWSQYNEHGGWGWKQDYDQPTRDIIWRDYEAIFHELLPKVVEQYAPGSDYWPSSPMQALTGDEHQHAGSDTPHGDIHYWGVWHSVEPFEEYNVNIGRFMSEYGFQSFPEYKTVRTYAEEKDMELLSEVMLKHQKNGQGNSLIKQYMDMYLPEPKDFPSFLYMSQILQAEAMKMAIEAHRRRKPFTMGTLYWQMNDCWPVASWSSMDYYGRWKATQYYVKNSCADVIVSIDGRDASKLDIYVVSDKQQPIEGVLTVKLYDFAGNVVKEQSQPIEVQTNTSVIAQTLKLASWLEGADPNAHVLVAQLEQNGELIDRVMHYFVSKQRVALSKSTVKVQEVAGSDGSEFIVEAIGSLAMNVWLSSEVEGIFSDNFFDLIPGEPLRISFKGRSEGESAFKAASPGALEVKSLIDMI